MRCDSWKYYNHAAVPTCAPHEKPDLTLVEDGSIWKGLGGGKPLLARWTTNWDCGHETGWWYLIKDKPFDIAELKSKRRYEINKGKKNFDVIIINPIDYLMDIYVVLKDAYGTYPKSYKPNITFEHFSNDVKSWTFYRAYGAFSNNDGSLCAFAYVTKKGTCINFVFLKAKPSSEKQGVNAAIVSKIMEDNNLFLASGGYICDGERNILHNTAFQDYLEKYFGFRKAYCKLHVRYRLLFGVLIKLCYLFRFLFRKFDFAKNIGRLNALLKMEEINRSFKYE